MRILRPTVRILKPGLHSLLTDLLIQPQHNPWIATVLPISFDPNGIYLLSSWLLSELRFKFGHPTTLRV